MERDDDTPTVRLPPDHDDAWSLLAERLLVVVDERIAAMRVEIMDELDRRIAIPDVVDVPER